MKKSKVKERESIENIAKFLKYLHDSPSEHRGLQAEVKNLPIMLYTYLIGVLISKDILGKTRHGMSVVYFWKTTTEPNLTMAEAVLKEMQKRHKASLKKNKAKVVKPEKTDQDVYFIRFDSEQDAIEFEDSIDEIYNLGDEIARVKDSVLVTKYLVDRLLKLNKLVSKVLYRLQ